ncbi:MAG: hypothetical protein KDC98_26525 [Planctomycetes bacterium]|nr:hypothetical protein [Planctomycetota bacterium]
MREAVAVIEERFAAGERILVGMAPVAADQPIVEGDELLFGVCLEDGSRKRIWYLHLRVVCREVRRGLDGRFPEDFEDRIRPDPARQREIDAGMRPLPDGVSIWDLATDLEHVRIRVEAFDGNGRSLATAESLAFEKTLRDGLVEACAIGNRMQAKMAGRIAMGRDAPMLELPEREYDDARRVGAAAQSCRKLFDILKENPVTREILFEVIALPSLGSILTRWEVTTKLSVDFFAAEPFAAGEQDAEGSHRSVPMTILLNDEPALFAMLVAGPAGSPNGAAVGVCRVLGRHPWAQDRRLTVELLASRRGGTPP